MCSELLYHARAENEMVEMFVVKNVNIRINYTISVEPMNLTIFSPMLHLIERIDDFLKFFYFIHNFIVNRWAEKTKMPRFLFVRSLPLHNLLFCPHTLWMSYVTNTFLLVSPLSVVNNYCVLGGVKARKQNNNIQQKTLTSFITIPLY